MPRVRLGAGLLLALLLLPIPAYADTGVTPSTWIGWIVTIALFGVSLLTQRLDRREHNAEVVSTDRVLQVERRVEQLTADHARTREQMVTRADLQTVLDRLDRMAEAQAGHHADSRERMARVETDLGRLADMVIGAPGPSSPPRG